jgi:hypothetical protein
MNPHEDLDWADRGIPSWFEIATSRPVVRRAFGYLMVVGSILVAINHGDALLRGDVDGTRLAKIILTPFVPYVVSTLSSVSAIRAQAGERSRA